MLLAIEDKIFLELKKKKVNWFILNNLVILINNILFFY